MNAAARRIARAAVCIFAAAPAPRLMAADAAKSPPIRMEPFKVSEDPLDSFGLGLQVIGDPRTHKVLRLLVIAVDPRSEALRSGIKPGDEVVEIDGKPVSAMDGRMARGGELFDLLVNRPPGTRLDLKIVTRVSRELTLHAYNGIGPPP